MTTDFELPAPGDRVSVKAADYAFGPSFLAGAGTVLENPDPMDRLKDNVLIRFDRGVTGRFSATVLKELLDGEPVSPSAVR